MRGCWRGCENWGSDGRREGRLRMATWQLGEIHHLGLTVADIERSIRFYSDVLGLILVRRRSTDADYIGQQTGYPGVRLEAASFKVSLESRQSIEVVQYATHT